MISDRELLIGLFNAVGELAERLTGEKLVVRMRAEDGRLCDVYATSMRAYWTNNLAARLSQTAADPDTANDAKLSRLRQ